MSPEYLYNSSSAPKGNFHAHTAAFNVDTSMLYQIPLIFASEADA